MPFGQDEQYQYPKVESDPMRRWLKILVLLGFVGLLIPFSVAETASSFNGTRNESTTVLLNTSSSGEFSCTRCLVINNTTASEECGDILPITENSTMLEASLLELKAIQAAIEEHGMNWHANITSFSKMPPEQRAALLGVRLRSADGDYPATPATSSSGVTAAYPSTLDWRNKSGNWTTPVRDQAHCGSCYAFATVGAYESRLEISTNDPDLNPDFSEQEIVSCSGCGGCVGSYMYCPMNWIRNTGVVEESCFPYAGTAVPCTTCTDPVRYKPEDWILLWNADENSIKTALMRGPIVGTFVVYTDFFSYDGGVYEYTSGEVEGGHAVVLVGWGEDDRGTYWIAKNSWGPDFGEDGYFRIRSGNCQINNELYEIIVPYSLDSEGIALFRPAESINWIIDAHVDGTADYSDHYGLSPDLPLMNDFNNDGSVDRAVFRNGEWIFDYSTDGTVDARDIYGMTGDVPFSGDINNDGTMDRGVFRRGEWIFDYSLDGSVDSRSTWGMTGDVPVVGDFNGDGTTDRAVFRCGAIKNWIFDYSIDSTSDYREHYGMAGDVPLAGDLTGNGSVDRVVFRNGEWIIDWGMDLSVDQRFQFGIPGDRPVLWYV